MDWLINPKHVAYVFDSECKLCWTENCIIFFSIELKHNGMYRKETN